MVIRAIAQGVQHVLKQHRAEKLRLATARAPVEDEEIFWIGCMWSA